MSKIEWDGYVQNDGVEYVTLPEGDYEFTVTGIEHKAFEGSEKIGPCDMVTLELTFDAEGVGRSVIKENIFLDTSVEWKISSFLRSIGKKKHGEKVKMEWMSYKGLTGMAHIFVQPFIGNDNKTRTANKVYKFLDPQIEEEPDADGDSDGALQFELKD